LFAAVQARAIETAAAALEKAGCFGLVLECVPRALARRITQKLSIPTFGIGAGPDCDGQVLVTHDLLNLTGGFHPKFARAFAKLDTVIRGAVESFKDEVQAGSFPSESESFSAPREKEKSAQGSRVKA